MDRALDRRDDGGAKGRLEALARRDGRSAAHETMNKGDELVERGAERLEEMAQKAVAKGGVAAKLAEPLAEDAAFLRKLKPSLMKARARGEAPTDQEPGAVTLAPSGPQLGARPKPGGGGPSPFVVIGIALAAGILLAKVIDWRGHAHPRD